MSSQEENNQQRRRRLVQDNDSSDDNSNDLNVSEDDDFDNDNDRVEDGQGRRRHEEEESEGEDLLDNPEQDYVAMDELDRYEQVGLDESESVTDLEIDERMRAEKEMEKRDRVLKKGRFGLLPMLDDEEDGEEEEDEEEGGEEARRRAAARRRRRMERSVEEGRAFDEAERMDGETMIEVDLENYDVPVTEFISRAEIQNEITNRFRKFVTKPSNNYVEKIQELVAKNLQSLQVSYEQLAMDLPVVAVYLTDVPMKMLEIFDDVVTNYVVDKYPHYSKIHDRIHVRITHYPISEAIRDLRCIHLNTMIRVSGVVTRRTSVLPRLKVSVYKCDACENVSPPIVDSGMQESKPGGSKLACNYCGSQKMSLDAEKTLYSNFQRIVLQESPGTVPAGRVPRQKEIILLDDLIDSVRPGEEVEVTGTYKSLQDASLNNQNSFPVFSTKIEANFVQKREDLLSSLRVTESDKRALRALAAEPRILERIIKSIAPSIYGNEHVKTALALGMFGGREKNLEKKHRVRGDINVLLLGDPGTAKSQCLKYVEKTAPRAVFTTGKGASAVGLTASVRKDPVTREWVLEGGALVLADRGVCLIDEFDKMNDQDRTSIHEAMEQQSISISKAGIVTTLQARCSVMAAANPIGGRYDPQKSFAENVELTDPILQRFDVLCVLQDSVDEAADKRLAKFVVSSHVRSHPERFLDKEKTKENDGVPLNVYDDRRKGAKSKEEGELGLIDQETLRKYIIFARSLRPELRKQQLDEDKIIAVYALLRKVSADKGGVPIAVRHAESIIRMAEAFARMHLREYVMNDDVDMAIRVMVESFVQGQKFAVKKEMRHSFRNYLTYKRDHNELLLFFLEELARDRPVGSPISREAFEGKAREYGVHTSVQNFLESDKFIKESGFSLVAENVRGKLSWFLVKVGKKAKRRLETADKGDEDDGSILDGEEGADLDDGEASEELNVEEEEELLNTAI